MVQTSANTYVNTQVNSTNPYLILLNIKEIITYIPKIYFLDGDLTKKSEIIIDLE